MKLYTVKTEDGYLRRKNDVIFVVGLDKASVFATVEEAQAIRLAYGSGRIAELTLTEKVLD